MGVLAVALAAVNVFGGFLVTRRMLEMFKKKDEGAGRKPGEADMSLNLVTLLYLVASVCFIQALKGLTPPDHVDPRQPVRHDRHGDRRRSPRRR